MEHRIDGDDLKIFAILFGMLLDMSHEDRNQFCTGRIGGDTGTEHWLCILIGKQKNLMQHPERPPTGSALEVPRKFHGSI
jgi:hypothetical protein